jgi:hypothetical protein
MRAKQTLSALVLMGVLFNAGCIPMMQEMMAAPMPTKEQALSADYGPYPDNYEQIVKDYFSKFLFDPYSAVYTFGTIERGYDRSNKLEFGWIVCGTINAKNRMGGYVGAKDYSVMIRYNQVILQRDYCPRDESNRLK